MNPRSLSIAKIGQDTVNEDAARASSDIIAISDGAGGGGLYAEKWAKYLIDKLPPSPIKSFAELDNWIGNIWEPFYNECEKEAQKSGGMLLDKFYDEGSFATLTAVWRTSKDECHWISYGDSVSFHYDATTEKLEFSIPSILDFEKPPYLINCKDELNTKGFRIGRFKTSEHSVVFSCSDALSFYIIMAYELAHCNEFGEDLHQLELQNSRYTNCLRMAVSENLSFKIAISKILNCRNNEAFKKHMMKLLKNKLICLDDYSIAVLPYKL